MEKSERSKPKPAPQALLFFAVFSQRDDVLDATIEILASVYGKIVVQSPRFHFVETDYYERSMGEDLRKQLIAVDRLIVQDELADIKIATGKLEEEIQNRFFGSRRAVNIDPGMIDGGKVMLASTKNNAHRIYLGRGIFAEVTLYLRHGVWEPWPWTYPDYRRADVHEFITAARTLFRSMTGAE